MILFNKFSELLPVLACARAFGNLWSDSLGVNILSAFSWISFNEKNPLLKALTFCLPLRGLFTFSQVISFSFLLFRLLDLVYWLKLPVSFFNLVCSSSASSSVSLLL